MCSSDLAFLVTLIAKSGTTNATRKASTPSDAPKDFASRRSRPPTETLANTASVTLPSGVTDPNFGNNSATDTDTITLKADLKITVNDGKSAAVAGTKNTYTITLSNLGPSNVAGAVIDALASLDLAYPKVSEAKKKELAEARKLLLANK